MMKEQLRAIVTVLSLMNRRVWRANRSREERLADAAKAAMAMTVILTPSCSAPEPELMD